MSWIHKGKTNAHNHIGLDHQLAQEHGFQLPVQSLRKRPEITHQALLMLANLNTFDRQQVLKEIDHLTQNPGTPYSIRHSRNPFRRIYRTRYPFRAYHYLIQYKLDPSGEVVIDDILFDETMVGARADKHAAERTMLYQVERLGPQNYDVPKSRAEIVKLQSAWGDPTAVTHVTTEHAAVNGMQNDLAKASWLMGVHAQAAYADDKIASYTLFHNPSDGIGLDGIECAFDKRRGTKSHNAQHLAAVLAQRQQAGKATKWVAHSQGAIIFCAALEHYRIHYQKPLNLQHLAVHGSGAHLPRLEAVARGLSMKVQSPRNNPFDLVPNVAGRNDLSGSGLVRSMRFAGLVFGDDIGASPHTLPYLGIETYRMQLVMLGRHQKAQAVQAYIRKQAE